MNSYAVIIIDDAWETTVFLVNTPTIEEAREKVLRYARENLDRSGTHEVVAAYDIKNDVSDGVLRIFG